MKERALSCWFVLYLLSTTTVLTAQAWRPVGLTPRASHSAVLDPTSDSILVFGGAQYIENGGRVDLNDLWRLSRNLSWIALQPTGVLPIARFGHTAVYDSANNRMMVFGGGEGNASPCANDVWVLTDANGLTGTPAWIQLNPAGSLPGPRIEHGAAYDPNTNSMIVYGGSDCFTIAYGDVWVLSNANGLGGPPAWTQLSPSGGGPGPREVQGGVAYDSVNNLLLVFGGSTTQGDNNDVWVLSNANGQGGTPAWSQLSPSGALPSPRDHNSTDYDPVTNRLIIFGGSLDPQHIFQDTWVLTNANGLGGTPNWTQLSLTNPLPNGRFAHTGVYNASTNKMTIYGGLAFYDSVHAIVENDAWVLSHANGK